ncbi:MAG: DEAD/DEAH box helicase [Deltaproteobacteria bacterium]|nr:DEAD/DEAH box helicase [Deltaproteobacteria bacterium]
MVRGEVPGPVIVTFDMGTVVVELNGNELPDGESSLLTWDHRVGALRGEAMAYRSILEMLVRHRLPFDDRARAYETFPELAPTAPFRPYPHQVEALEAWKKGGMRGVVVLPTGSGKTWLAHLALQHCRRSALVVVPTLDLVSQWASGIERAFGRSPGIIGGGDFSVRPLTVITYDSAIRHMESLGNRFGLIVFDECHHLPSPTYALAARLALSPFRLGLTATPERTDGGEALLEELVGPVVYSSRVSTLAGDILAPYKTVRVLVDLTPEEVTAYQEARAVYLDFCASKGVKMSAPDGYRRFLQETARSHAGRAAFEAYLRQRNIPLESRAKFDELSALLQRHRGDRIILFTHVNEMAYRIARRYLLPVITHQTPPRERAEILSRFGTGAYPAVVTSRVLNEGVDVPEASVGVVMSGTGSIREHVQRLGRILRRREGKEAVLYEVVARDTHEEGMSRRRTQHEAYRNPNARKRYRPASA